MTCRAFAAWCASFAAVLLVGVGTAGAQSPEFKDEPDTHMAAAQESFIKGDMNASAEHIKKAATYVRGESSKVTKSASASLKKSFAKADHALAKAWHETAATEQKAGRDSTNALSRAGSSLEGAATWTGTQLEGGARAAVDAAHSAGRTANQGVRMGKDAVGRAFRGIGDGIADIGRKISP